MNLFLCQRNVVVLLALVVPTMLLGCSDSKRQGIEGTVTFNGEKVENGSIHFVPINGTKGPDGGATIENGHFSIPKEGGVFVGTFKVTIEARKKTGKKTRDVEGHICDEEIDYIPAKYNEQSTLTQEIKSGSNNLTFDLTP